MTRHHRHLWKASKSEKRNWRHMKHLCGKTKFPRYLMWRSFIPEFVLNTIRASAETAEISSWSLSGASCVFQVPNDDFFPNFLLQLRHFFSQTTIRVKALRKISRKSILLWEVGGGVSFNPWFARWLCCFNSHIFCSMPIQFVLFIQFIYIYIIWFASEFWTQIMQHLPHVLPFMMPRNTL